MALPPSSKRKAHLPGGSAPALNHLVPGPPLQSCTASLATLTPPMGGAGPGSGHTQTAQECSFPVGHTGGRERRGMQASPWSGRNEPPRTTPPPSHLQPDCSACHTPGLGLDCEGVAPMLLLQADQHIVEALVKLQEEQQAGGRCLWGHQTASLSPVTSLLLPHPSPFLAPLSLTRNKLSLLYQLELETAHQTQKTKGEKWRKWAPLLNRYCFGRLSFLSTHRNFLKCLT